MEREINELIHGIHVRIKSQVKAEPTASAEKEKLKAKAIDDDDVCPICQEEFISGKELLTHCRYANK